MKPDTTLGKFIRQRRRQIGMTQNDLAEAMGNHASTISAWETDRNTPRISTCYAIADAIESDPFALLVLAGYEEPENPLDAASFPEWVDRQYKRSPYAVHTIATRIGVSDSAFYSWRQNMPRATSTAAIALLADLFDVQRRPVLRLAELDPAYALRVGALPAHHATIARWLAATRQICHLSKRQVAERIDVAHSTVSAWERRRRHPRMDYCKRLAHAFKVPEDELLNLAGYARNGGLPRVVETRACHDCPVREQCQNDASRGLPIWCEAIKPDDIQHYRCYHRLEAVLARYPQDTLDDLDLHALGATAPAHAQTA
jgi:transcriptional regulator with XRE-family HTH domain